MEMICVGFLIGALVAIVFFGSGVGYGFYQGTSDRHRGSCGCDSESDRYCRSDDRYSSEEVIDVIDVVRMYASAHEKKVLDQVRDDYERGCENGKGA